MQICTQLFINTHYDSAKTFMSYRILIHYISSCTQKHTPFVRALQSDNEYSVLPLDTDTVASTTHGGKTRSNVWSFDIERPILGDNPKPHKFACSGRLPFVVTEA